MLIRYRNGLLLEAMLLSLKGGTLRVALKESDDVAEFRLVGDTWFSESGDPVTFDLTMAILAAVGIAPPADGPAATQSDGLALALTPDLQPSFSHRVN